MSQLDNQRDGWQDQWEEEEPEPLADEQEALPPNSSYEWMIAEETAGIRLDRFLVEQLPGLSRNQVQSWIEQGNVLVQGQASKPGYKLRLRDLVTLVVPERTSTELQPENIQLEIVYEDSDLLVVDKPRGLVVHPAAGHYTGTLVNALLFHCKELSNSGSTERPGIVHRIDKDTSGLLMVAKNDFTHRGLSEQLSAHSVTRRYLGIAHGVITHDVGTIEAAIGRHPVHRQKMAVTRSGKHAVTHFTVLERFEQYTFVECRLETGRTHQIRVHFDFIGHPLAGDPLYGPKRTLTINGQALHAATLGFVHPRTQQYLEFQSPLPSDMEELLHQLTQG